MCSVSGEASLPLLYFRQLSGWLTCSAAVLPPTTTEQQAPRGLGQRPLTPCPLREGSACPPMGRYSVNTEECTDGWILAPASVRLLDDLE